MNWQIAFITICIVKAAVAHTTYCVLPSDWPSTQCPLEDCNSSNLTALLNSDILCGSVSNVTLLLYPGEHIVSSSENRVFSIISATNFALKAVDSSQRATIRCNKTIGFEFDSCINLTMSDITIENCGAQKYLNSRMLPEVNFSVYISHSLGVYIAHTHIVNGTGIGLLLENVQNQLLILDSILSYNDGNLYIVSYDNSRIKSIPISMRILNSFFSDARGIKSQRVYSGITIHMYQTKFSIEIELKNVTIVNAKSENMYAELNLCTTVVKLYNLTSISIHKEQNLNLKLMHSTKCIHVEQQYNFTMDNANLTGGDIFIEGKGGKGNLATIFINNTDISQSIIRISEVKHAFLTNVTIQKSESQKNMLTKNCALHFIGYFSYQNNRGSLLFQNNSVIFETYSRMLFRHNNQTLESPLYSINSNIKMLSGSSLIIENNTGYQSGGLTLENSIIRLEGNTHVLFLHNTGKRGGAMAFYALSQLVFTKEHSNLIFIGNHATIVGGAIYVHDYDFIYRQHSRTESRYHKFMEISSAPNQYITFINNTAIQAGNALYGGTGNKKTFFFDNSNKDNLSVGSTNPFKVCICNNLIPNCSIRWLKYHLIPGKSFKIDLVAVGQWNGVVPANIQIEIKESSQAKVKASEHIQSTGRKCTQLVYTFKYLKQHDSFHLQVITTNRNFVNQERFFIRFFLLNCTLGFSFVNDSRTCICNRELIDHGIECDIEILTIRRPIFKWINATFDHLLPLDLSGVIVHNHCPYDYCIVTTDGLVQQLNLNYPDQQCALHRSGILCGGCEAKFSQVLGTSKCKMCTNSRLPLLLFLIAFAGIALVVSLMLLNITVSVGTINGLMFYANILRANQAFFFPQSASTSFLSTFIAWLNLDLGIETCLYNGLDAYFKTWLQFLFPLYIWLIVTIIIVIAHYSTKASKLIGKNPVQVLATLFLLSYAKLLRTIITVLSSTELTYPDGYVRRVWLYDGNMDFFKGKHIPLFTVALVFLILVSIPFTATLMCIQWLQRFSHHKLLVWVIKLQPLFDAYTGPYKIKHRYWTGLLLLIRVCLFLVFSLNIFGDPIINLLTIVACMFSLFAYLSIFGGVYKLWLINVIETAFIMNLGLLSAAGLYKVAANVSITPITYTSTGIAFLLFVAIVSYHLIARMSQTKCGQILIARVKKMYHSLRQRRITLDTEEDIISDSDCSDNIVTYSEVELTEPLLVID